MMNVCSNCGLYRPDKRIDLSGPFAICPECEYKHTFRQLPLLMICGASGTGKSTICQQLQGKLPQVILLDADILWRPEFNTPDDNYKGFFETWLRLSKNISQSEQIVALFCAGGIPDNIEDCIERRYFTNAHYLALTCDENVLTERLKSRPAWRNSSDMEFIRQQIEFNRWFTEKGQYSEPSIDMINTTDIPVDETRAFVSQWIVTKIEQQR